MPVLRAGVERLSFGGNPAALLWPDVGAARACTNLRQRSFRMHKLFGFDLLEGTVVASQPAALEIDLGGNDVGAAELLAGLTTGDTGGKWVYFDAAILKGLGVRIAHTPHPSQWRTLYRSLRGLTGREPKAPSHH